MDFSNPVVSDFQRRVFRAERPDRTAGWRLDRRQSRAAGISHSGKCRQPARPAGSSEDDEAKVKELGFDNIADLRETVDHAVLVWVPRVMFVLLPLFAWLVALAYGRVDPNYLHHVIFAVHVHAAWFAAAAIAKAGELLSRPVGDALRQLVVVFAVVYTVLAFRRVYGAMRLSLRANRIRDGDLCRGYRPGVPGHRVARRARTRDHQTAMKNPGCPRRGRMASGTCCAGTCCRGRRRWE